MNFEKMILASGSPRRAQIMSSVGWDFEIRVPGIDETEIPDEEPDKYVQRLALEKARAIANSCIDSLVLGADTTVVVDGRIIGKPIDKDDARAMIRLLSGRWHQVLTGIALVKNEKSRTGIQLTDVKFGELGETEVAYLVENGDPLDKAGAYAIQAEAALFIEEIKGDYWNIVGLPINLVYRLFREFESPTAKSGK